MVVAYLRNERYCGDVLARKTWTPDFHTHKSVKNTGKKNRYYQPGHHEAIVTRAQWNAAQRMASFWPGIMTTSGRALWPCRPVTVTVCTNQWIR